MPADHRSRCHQDERSFPMSPDLPQSDPEQLVPRGESPARPLGVEGQKLLTKCAVFQNEFLARTKGAERPAEQVTTRDHGENLTETQIVGLAPNSLILRVHDVLMRHRYGCHPRHVARR
jgi:hypothetical protein